MDKKIKSQLEDHLSIYKENLLVRSSALDELIGKLKSPRALYELLSSKLTVKETLWVIAKLVKEGMVEINRSSEGYQLNFTPQVIENSTAVISTGLHLVDAREFNLNNKYLNIVSELYKDKNLSYDQSIETYKSQIRRYKTMQSLGDLSHENLLLLGDDAYFSLFLVFHGVKSNIHVADIDESVLSFIEETCKIYNLNKIETTHYNVFDPLPEQLRNRFDCFSVNGFKDLGGLLTFICRGIQSLISPTKNRAGYFNYSNHEIECKIQDKIEIDLQKFFSRSGIYMDYIVPCPESQVSEEFTQGALDLIGTLDLSNDLETTWREFEQAMDGLKQEYSYISWVAMENFPDIQLSPLKLARMRIYDLQKAEIEKYLRISALYNNKSL